MLSGLSAKDISQFAGSCPLRLLGLTPDNDITDDVAFVLNQDEAEEDNLEEPNVQHNRAFRIIPAEPRFKFITGRDSGQDATLFEPLMDECRRTQAILNPWH